MTLEQGALTLDRESLEQVRWIPDLFGFLYHLLEQEKAILRIIPENWPGGCAGEAGRLREELSNADMGKAPDSVVDYLLGDARRFERVEQDPLSRAYTLAQCIDSFVAPVHPRHLETHSTVHMFLSAAYAQRGVYSSEEYPLGLVLPRGPLRGVTTGRSEDVEVLEPLADGFRNFQKAQYASAPEAMIGSIWAACSSVNSKRSRTSA